jgi:hypothetical protein
VIDGDRETGLPELALRMLVDSMVRFARRKAANSMPIHKEPNTDRRG